MTRRTGFVCDDAFFIHETDEMLGPWVAPGSAFETVAGKRRIRDLLREAGLLERVVQLSPRPLERSDLLRFHTEAHVANVERISASGGGDTGDDAWCPPGGYAVALLAAGGAYEAVRAVVTGEVDNAYALVRPPGHHAEADRGRGYCVFGNVALAVLKARDELGVGRVAVVDWDVHHGNGTERAFLDDPSVLTVSLHQDRLYPRDSGGVGETGVGATVNVPLPAGSGAGAYASAFERVVEPVVRRFAPELLVVACGFDAGALDPLGRMMLTADAFGDLTRRVRLLADELCGGRLVLSHEGGYSELHAPFCGLRVVEELSGLDAGVPDPFDWLGDYGGQQLQPHQAAAIDEAVRVHGL